MGTVEFERMFHKADKYDFQEGLVAYQRYHIVMRRIGDHYGFDHRDVAAVFCSLSPNSDYKGNLRSTVSVLEGVNDGVDQELVTVSTYKHCRRRAWAYARGDKFFPAETKGLKILNFYYNICDPEDMRWVTIDGHMSAIWQGKDLTMREALVKPSVYAEMKADLIKVAFRHFMLPNQMQAVLWFTRKRTSRVMYDPQLELFADRGDVWKTLVDPRDIVPYPRKLL